MKNLTKKLFLSMLTVAFAVVALGTTTFAWFTLATEAKIEAFAGQVTAGEGFEVAVVAQGAVFNEDTAKWYAGSLPTTAIEEAYKGKFVKFDAVSPVVNSSNFDKANTLQFAPLSIDLNTPKAEMGQAIVTDVKPYIAFDLYFRLVNKTDLKYNLHLKEFELIGQSQTWTADADYNLNTSVKFAAGDKAIYDVSNAARLAVIAPDYAETVKAHYYEKEEGSVVSVKGNPTTVTNTEGFVGHDLKANSAALDYFLSKNNIKKTTNETLLNSINTLFDTCKTNYKAETATTSETGDLIATFDGTEGTIKLSVFVWIEGWDGECMNAIFNQKLTTSMKFGIEQIVAQ